MLLLRHDFVVNVFKRVDFQELIESEAERLQQIVHMHELQKLTRKYRLSSIIDQVTIFERELYI